MSCHYRRVSLTLLVVIYSVYAESGSVSKVTYRTSNGADWISTSDSNYAIAEQSLAANNWKSISLNGNQLVIISPSCEVTAKDLVALSDDDRKLIDEAKTRLSMAYRNEYRDLHDVQPESSDPGGLNSKDANASGSNKGISIEWTNDNNFSVSKDDLPNNVARIFVNNNMTTFVYHDGFVLMRPSECLSSDELLLIEKVKLEIREARRALKEDQGSRIEKLNESDEERDKRTWTLGENIKRETEERRQRLLEHIDSLSSQLRDALRRNAEKIKELKEDKQQNG